MNQVYLIQSSLNGYYKIGISKNPQKRIKQLQCGSGEKLSIITTYKSNIAHKIEKAMHNNYAPFKINGEWFKLAVEDEIDFINKCKLIESNILLLMENNSFFE